MRTGNASRGQLGRFLRSRRERLNPADAGFPSGPRRRSLGLRREEVAVLAGLSPTWYTYLEQGRDIRPSPEVMDSLARVLLLTEDERRYIHTLAYGQVIGPLPLESDLGVDDLLRQVVAVEDDNPYPVYAVNHYYDLVAWNRAAAVWYDDWSRYPCEERNIVRWMLTSPQAKARLLNWEREAKDTVAQWRAESAKWPDDELLVERIDQMIGLSPLFAEWWDEQVVQENRSRMRRFRKPRLGVATLRVLPLRSPEFAPAGIMFHLPAEAR
jgi:transcriptional regulator with XRE-family HTH domain